MLTESPDPLFGEPDRPARATPSGALTALLAGNRRFVRGEPRYGHHISDAMAAGAEQHPIAAVLGCLDSRVPPEAVLDQDFGTICVIRTGGHVLDRAVTSSIEFTVAGLGVPLVLVLGHSRCAAVEAACAQVRAGVRPAGSLGFLVNPITPAVPPDASVPATVQEHVRRTVTALCRLDRLRDLVGSGALRVVGAVYQHDSGRVELLT